MLSKLKTALLAMLLTCSAFTATNVAFAGEPKPGKDAPKVTTSKWYNNAGNLNWEELEGKVILLELWAST